MTALEVRPLNTPFGAEIMVAELVPGDAALVSAVEAAIGQYGLVLFRNAKLDDETLTRFAAQFGPLQNLSPNRDAFDPLAHISNLTKDGEMMPVDDAMHRQNQANQLWHIDSSYLIPGATFSLLHARIVPSSGGDTEYCDTRVAWDALPPERRAKLVDLLADHSIFHSRQLIGFAMEGDRAKLPSIRRKLVRRHRPSGRDALIIASHIEHIEGLDYAEARALVDELIALASRPACVYRHKWTPGDLLMWDNRCVLHRGTPYEQFNQPRDLRSCRINDVADEGVISSRGQATLAAAG
jgi:alpha-ketoglutarate-dependent 2,4-dichlorophenoxyacetate dioxygenase